MQEWGGGPAVERDVVKGRDKHVVGLGERDERRTQAARAGQVERHDLLAVQMLPCSGEALVRGQVAEIDDAQRARGDGVCFLVRHAVDGHDGAAQHGVATDDLAESRLERGRGHLHAQAQDHGNDVDGLSGMQLLEEPQALLRERQRSRPAVTER